MTIHIPKKEGVMGVNFAGEYMLTAVGRFWLVIICPIKENGLHKLRIVRN